MALPNSPGSPGAGKPNPSVIDLGTIFVDSDIIFGFTSHLLKRKKRVRALRSETPGRINNDVMSLRYLVAYEINVK